MKKVLIVEDNVSMRFLLERIFKESYNVRTADDGLTAMMILNKGFIPDIIVTDLNMPSINGWELISYLKKSSLYGNVPIIALSSHTVEELQSQYPGLQIEDNIKKPFEPKELLIRVSTVLQKVNHLTFISQ